MLLMVWIVLGLLAGFIGSKFINKRGEGGVRDIFLGISGAVMAGFIFSTIQDPAAGRLTLDGLLVSTIGAVGLLLVYHGLRRMSA